MHSSGGKIETSSIRREARHGGDAGCVRRHGRIKHHYGLR